MLIAETFTSITVCKQCNATFFSLLCTACKPSSKEVLWLLRSNKKPNKLTVHHRLVKQFTHHSVITPVQLKFVRTHIAMISAPPGRLTLAARALHVGHPASPPGLLTSVARHRRPGTSRRPPGSALRQPDGRLDLRAGAARRLVLI
jgi:hypothetical protein